MVKSLIFLCCLGVALGRPSLLFNLNGVTFGAVPVQPIFGHALVGLRMDTSSSLGANDKDCLELKPAVPPATIAAPLLTVDQPWMMESLIRHPDQTMLTLKPICSNDEREKDKNKKKEEKLDEKPSFDLNLDMNKNEKPLFGLNLDIKKEEKPLVDINLELNKGEGSLLGDRFEGDKKEELIETSTKEELTTKPTTSSPEYKPDLELENKKDSESWVAGMGFISIPPPPPMDPLPNPSMGLSGSLGHRFEANLEVNLFKEEGKKDDDLSMLLATEKPLNVVAFETEKLDKLDEKLDEKLDDKLDDKLEKPCPQDESKITPKPLIEMNLDNRFDENAENLCNMMPCERKFGPKAGSYVKIDNVANLLLRFNRNVT